ncbi:hypothetical protein JAAARDRAFT_418705, partial [Jaapia argillacea MUCL 33604]
QGRGRSPRPRLALVGHAFTATADKPAILVPCGLGPIFVGMSFREVECAMAKAEVEEIQEAKTVRQRSAGAARINVNKVKRAGTFHQKHRRPAPTSTAIVDVSPIFAAISGSTGSKMQKPTGACQIVQARRWGGF